MRTLISGSHLSLREDIRVLTFDFSVITDFPSDILDIQLLMYTELRFLESIVHLKETKSNGKTNVNIKLLWKMYLTRVQENFSLSKSY